jgi:sensor histidine kinase regulating citrate/malate metabolism
MRFSTKIKTMLCATACAFQVACGMVGFEQLSQSLLSQIQASAAAVSTVVAACL